MTTIRDNGDASRYEILDGDELAGIVEYERRDGTIALLHTETLAGHEGKGIAGRLVRQVLDDARAAGVGVLPYCPYVRKLIADHPDEHLDLVPAEARDKFGLPAA